MDLEAVEVSEAKRFKCSTVSDHIFTNEFQELFGKSWHGYESIHSNDINIVSKPFRVCKISNFIQSDSFLEELKNELSEVKSRRQSIDLYQFEQTHDLASVESKNLKRLYQTFQTDVATWMEKNTRIELNRSISMSSSCYFDTDYLLCHDDNMGDRRIAFVLYLSKNWTAEDGGSLDLFDTDENGLPRNVVHSLVPEYNSLVFFEVVDNSYHQVAEVRSPEKSRWTINGWFHGPLRISDRPPRPEIEIKLWKPTNIAVKLNSWITESYLYTNVVKEIQLNVERKSYTFLAKYLKSDIYEKLSQDVSSETILWKRVGPADVRNYEIADETSLPTSLRNFYEIFKSVRMFRLLKDYTELDLVPNESCSMDPKMCIELQRWSNGCYTLICDRPAGYEKAMRDDESSPSPTTKTTSNGGGNDHRSSKTQKDNRRACHTSTSSNDNEDVDEDEILRRILKGKAPTLRKKISGGQQQQQSSQQQHQQASCSKTDHNSQQSSSSKRGAPVNPDSEDSDVSDIGDYLSDPFDCSLECSEAEDDHEVGDSSVAEPGTLDVIMQFHTNKIPEDYTIDYVDPREQEGALIHVPSKDNHLCVVYKTIGTSRLHKYVNHYCKGYFYNLICTYYE